MCGGGGFARANRCCCMCICVTTFYENLFFLLFLPVLLSHSELEPSAASVNLSLSLSLSLCLLLSHLFVHALRTLWNGHRSYWHERHKACLFAFSTVPLIQALARNTRVLRFRPSRSGLHRRSHIFIGVEYLLSTDKFTQYSTHGRNVNLLLRRRAKISFALAHDNFSFVVEKIFNRE